MRIVSFSGRSGHGKDFVARLFRQMAEEKSARTASFSFADPLKARVYAEFGGKYNFEQVFYTKPDEVRIRLQQAGTEEGRDVFGEDFWTLQTEALIRLRREREPEIALATITDARFPNEVDFCLINGLSIATLQASSMRAAVASAIEHAQETNMPFLDENRMQAVGEQYFCEYRRRNQGLAFYIESDRPTLTGEAALHRSETSLDGLNKATAFSEVIVNNQDTSAYQLREQLDPWVTLALRD
jgi:hypothetical protein